MHLNSHEIVQNIVDAFSYDLIRIKDENRLTIHSKQLSSVKKKPYNRDRGLQVGSSTAERNVKAKP